MKLSLLVSVCCTAALTANAQVNVTQHHNHASRDGIYIDSAFTPSAAANLARDLNFTGAIVGNVYAQPLYIEGGPNGPMILAVTQSNNVYALNATTGMPLWHVSLDNIISNGPITYELDGTQYVVVAAGDTMYGFAMHQH